MIIITNKDLYVGRYNTPDHKEFNPIRPYGSNEPFKIEKGTEVVKLDGTEFDSFEEFTKAYEDGYFKFVFNDEYKESLFEMLIDYANIVNDCPEDYQIK